MSSNSTMFLKATLDGHKKVVNLFNQMTSTQINDAVDIGIDKLNIDVNPIQFKTLCTTINDLFGPMVSAMTTFNYCISNQNDSKLIITIILSHAYALFNPYMYYDHWPKTVVSEYLEYFEKLIYDLN